MNHKFKKSTLFRREYLFTVEQDPENLQPFQVVFKALSARDLDFIRSLETTNNGLISLFILEKSIVRFINAYYTDGTPIPHTNTDVIPLSTQLELATEIFRVSTVTSEDLDKLNMNITLAMEPKFSTDTWKCEECRSKGLDALRNCKFREDYSEIFDSSFVVIVDSIKYDHCPMYYKDNELISDSLSAYYSWEVGALPELGGLPEQTEFFGVATNVVKKAVRDLEAKNSSN